MHQLKLSGCKGWVALGVSAHMAGRINSHGRPQNVLVRELDKPLHFARVSLLHQFGSGLHKLFPFK